MSSQCVSVSVITMSDSMMAHFPNSNDPSSEIFSAPLVPAEVVMFKLKKFIRALDLSRKCNNSYVPPPWLKSDIVWGDPSAKRDTASSISDKENVMLSHISSVCSLVQFPGDFMLLYGKAVVRPVSWVMSSDLYPFKRHTVTTGNL